jgi:hypothetical protein
MKKRSDIDFSKVDWDAAKDNLEFFYREGLDFNNRLIDDINALNSKGFAILAVSLSAACAAAGALLASWPGHGKTALFFALACAFAFALSASVLAFLAVWPREIVRGEGSPFVYFSSGYYRQNKPSILAGNIQALDRYIQQNQRVMYYRGRLVTAAVAVSVFMPPAAAAVFLFFSL